eukprot:PhF_6_TR19753/c0_g1_i1/m.28817/K00326/E1.6.2.2; cytochrome-b5 reductase
MSKQWRALGTVGLMYTSAIAGTCAVGYTSWYAFHSYMDNNYPMAERVGRAFHPVPMRLIERSQETAQTTRYKFQLQNNFDYVGATVTSLMVGIPGTMHALNRWYTPISHPNQRGEVEFLIRLYPAGRLSNLFNLMKVGDYAEVRSCLSEYKYKPNEKKHIGMVAGGVGITPMMQLLTYALNEVGDETKFTLLYCNVTADTIALKKDLDKLAAQHPDRLKIHHNLMSPRGALGTDLKCTYGLIDAEALSVLPKPTEEGTQILVCGPNQLMAAVCGRPYMGWKVLRSLLPIEYTQGMYSGLLKQMGYPKSMVYKFGVTEENIVIMG